MTSFIGAHWLAPDATRVLVLAGDDPASPSTLFGVEVDTPTTRDRLSPDGPAGHQGVDPMVLSPDGVTVAFRGDLQTANLGQVFQAATPGVSARSPDIAGATVPADFAVASHGRSVAYRTDLRQTGQFELQASRLSEPGVAETLSGTLAPGDQVTAVAVR